MVLHINTKRSRKLIFNRSPKYRVNTFLGEERQ